MKTYRVLTSESVSPAVIHKRFAIKETVDLLRAVHNPDHSAAAIQALKALLHAEGLTEEQIQAFRLSDDLDVLPVVKTPSVEAALRRPTRWRAIYRGIQVVSLVFIVSSYYAERYEVKVRQAKVDELIKKGVISQQEYRALRLSGRQPFSDTDELNKVILANRLARSEDAPSSVLSMSLLWTAILLFGPVKLAAWSWPARILLLRPFDARDVSKSLYWLIRRNVSFSGHVFTLADYQLKESFLLYLISFVPLSPEGLWMLLLYPWSKKARRWIHVKNASDFQALKERLESRWLLNTFWTNSLSDKIRKVRTVDRWWQRCIDLLATNCDVILVDLSVVKSGTRWELLKIRNENLEAKCIFIIQKEQLEMGRRVLAEYWPVEALPEVHAYGEKGRLDNGDAFVNCFANALALPRWPFTGKPRLYYRAVFSLFTWWVPLVGLIISLSAWSVIARSEGRLKGKALAQFTSVLSALVLARYVWFLYRGVISGR
jgi:hypothetical protein